MRVFLATASVLAILSGGVGATQITYGPSFQSINFTGDGAGGLTISIPQLDMTAFDTTNAGLGGAWLYDFSPFAVGPEAGGIFAANASGKFKYIASDGDVLIEDIVIDRIQDNTPQPKFYFTGITEAISGDAAFLAAFGLVGTQDSGDWIMTPLSGGFTLDTLANTISSASATVSAGEKVVTPIPEPSFNFAWLLGLAAVGLYLSTRKPSPKTA